MRSLLIGNECVLMAARLASQKLDASRSIEQTLVATGLPEFRPVFPAGVVRPAIMLKSALPPF